MDSKTPPFSLEDIHSFLTSASFDVASSVIHVDSLAEEGYKLEAIFRDKFSVVLFLPNPNGEVGHFTLLTHLSDKTLEYFDSYARDPPEQVRELAKHNGMRILRNKVQLQEIDSNVCAKWCIARLYSLPNSLTSFLKLYTGHRELSPDTLVNNIFVLKKQPPSVEDDRH
jgi:hypothetical protein